MAGERAGSPWLVAAGLTAMVLIGMAQALYGPALPAYARTHGLLTSEAGRLVASHWIGAAVGVAAMFLAGGGLAPLTGLALMAAGTGLIAAQAGWTVTLAAALLVGCGGAILSTHYNQRFIAEFGRRGPAMIALLNALFGLGAIVTPIAYARIGGDPAAAFLGVTLAALLALPLVWRGHAGAPAAAGSAADPPGPFAPHWGVLAFGALSIGLEASLIGLGPTALVALGTGETRAAEQLSLFFLAFLAARLGLALVASRLPAFTLFTLGLVGLGSSALALAATGAAALFPALGFFAGVFFPMFFVTGSRLMGGHPRVAPTLAAAGLAGGVVGPLAIALAMSRLGDAVLFPAVAGLSLGAALLAVALQRGMTRAPRPGRA